MNFNVVKDFMKDFMVMLLIEQYFHVLNVEEMKTALGNLESQHYDHSKHIMCGRYGKLC